MTRFPSILADDGSIGRADVSVGSLNTFVLFQGQIKRDFFVTFNFSGVQGWLSISNGVNLDIATVCFVAIIAKQRRYKVVAAFIVDSFNPTE